MAPPKKDGSEATASTPVLPVAGRLKLKFPSLEALMNRLGRHIYEEGLFIPTETPRSAGTVLALQISLQSGEVVIEAEGEVLWTRRSHKPQEPTGMAFRFVRLSPASRKFVWNVARKNREAGIGSELDLDMQLEATAAKQIPQPSVDEMQGPIVGIDFGTTNSCVAFMDGDHPKLVPSDKGSLIIPSVVAINEQGKMLIGLAAKEQAVINPQNTIFGVKRFAGRNFRSPFVREMASHFSYPLKANENDEVIVTLAGKEYTLPEVCSFIITQLRESAEGLLGATIKRAIITIPAYFTESQRAAVKQAAQLAGLHVDLLLNEPTAAALAYGYQKEYDRRILVFDLGGGTFDVSILEVSANVFEVKATGGDTLLGGIDFDQRLIDYVTEQFEKKHSVSIQDNHVVLQRITNAAENAKIQLSFQEEAEIMLPYLVEKKGKPIDLQMTIQRQQLNDLTKDLVEKALEICGQVVHSMGLLPSNIDDVLLVGGQTRMPYLQERIQEYFKQNPSKGVHPDEAVALGAALLGGSMQSIDGPLLLDVLTLPIGMAMADGGFKEIFARYSPLPCRKRFDLNELPFATQTRELALYQGNHDRVDENEYLGTVKLLFPTLGDGLSDIIIEFELTKEGILKLRACHQPSGKTEILKVEIMAHPLITPEISKPVAERQGFFKKFFK